MEDLEIISEEDLVVEIEEVMEDLVVEIEEVMEEDPEVEITLGEDLVVEIEEVMEDQEIEVEISGNPKPTPNYTHILMLGLYIRY